MKTSKKKPVFLGSASSEICDAASKVSNTIKLNAVTMEERQRLRIPSYKYILP